MFALLNELMQLSVLQQFTNTTRVTPSLPEF